MIDLQILRKNPEMVKKNLTVRNVFFDIESLLILDKKITISTGKIEKKQNQRNVVSEQIAKNLVDDAQKQQLVKKTRELGKQIKEDLEAIRILKEDRKKQLSNIPNLLHVDVPWGEDEKNNKEICKVGEPTKFSFVPKSHGELGTKLGILDIARGVKIARSRFAFFKGAGAMLERILTQFMLDLHTKKHGYQEWQTPFLVAPASLYNTGQLPKFQEDLFQTTDGLYLIPTAEVPLTNIFQKEVLKEADLPFQFTAHTPCFRREVGSYGKDTKGLIRQHQFSKVELVWITHPAKSEEAHQKLLRHAESVLEKLELPYRTVLLCSGDTGFSAAKCYDIEVWIPSENTYREISSCSNCMDFQARRANIKYQPQGGKAKFVHTLNGSGLAVGRTWLAVLENYQQEDGSIKVPKILHKYTKGLTVLK